MSATLEQVVVVNPVPPEHVSGVVRSAEDQLIALLRQKTDITRRIGTVKKLLVGMANLFGDAILNDELRIALDRATRSARKGFTPACRQVLMDSTGPLRTHAACVALQQRFPEVVGHHKDLGASVTTVFHRLVKYGQARSFADDEGVRVWEWLRDAIPGTFTHSNQFEQTHEGADQTLSTQTLSTRASKIVYAG